MKLIASAWNIGPIIAYSGYRGHQFLHSRRENEKKKNCTFLVLQYLLSPVFTGQYWGALYFLCCTCRVMGCFISVFLSDKWLVYDQEFFQFTMSLMDMGVLCSFMCTWRFDCEFMLYYFRCWFWGLCYYFLLHAGHSLLSLFFYCAGLGVFPKEVFYCFCYCLSYAFLFGFFHVTYGCFCFYGCSSCPIVQFRV